MEIVDRIGSAFLRRILLREGAGRLADGPGAADEGVASVHHEGPAPGRQLLLPHGGETRERAQDGLLPGAPPTGRTDRVFGLIWRNR